MYNKLLLPLILIFFLTACSNMPESNKQSYTSIRLPAVAGTFYSDNETKLKSDIEKYLSKVEEKKIVAQAIMVPHAGHVYSAQVAASAYKTIDPNTKRVFLLANAHSAYFQGIALAGSEAWQNPLGLVEVDQETIKLIDNEVAGTSISREAHQSDHTLELQLPFLQNILSDFKIVPILFGQGSDYEEMAKWLNVNLVSSDLVLVSSDLSHYPSYDDAYEIDNKTLDLIVAKDINDFESHINDTMNSGLKNEETLACGETAIKVLMKMANEKDWSGEILKYANSGDKLLGDKDRVVGYGAIAFSSAQNAQRVTRNEAEQGGDYEGEKSNDGARSFTSVQDDTGGEGDLSDEQKKKLISIAKETVAAYVLTGKKPDFDVPEERLNWKEGAFVTLHEDGKLRGCIGQIIPTLKPLWKVVRDMAIEAATDDPRFQPVTKEDLEHLEYEVSVLSKPVEIDNWQDIELGKHGVIISKGLFNKGVFLPQVADETGWNLEEFLAHLAQDKAGLKADAYKDKDVKLEVFTAQVITD
jgi:AmmeMemoRadiSam system protein B/AmmeMemoRadiSam system protein A